MENWNFTKSNTSPSAFLSFLKLYEWYQIAKHITILKISAAFCNVRTDGRLIVISIIIVPIALRFTKKILAAIKSMQLLF